MIPRHPLAGLRVVEIGSRVSAAYCGKLLRDAGAQVIKVEPGGGDPLRRYRPVGTGPAASAAGPFFSYLAAGKRSVTVANTAALCASADIIVAAANPAQAREIGVDPAKYLEAQASCVVVTISDYGWTGPWTEYPATEFTLQAWCGSTGSRGVPERPPIAAGGDLGEFIAGGYAAFFALATHFGGGGAHVDLSVLEAMTSSMQTFGWLRKSVAGLQRFSRSTEVPSVEPAKGGYVGVSMGTDAQWLNFCRMIDRPDLAEIHELRFQLGRWKHRDMVRTAIGPWFAQQTVDEIVQLAETYRVPMVPIGNGATLPQMSHFVERNVFVRNPAGFRQPRPPWQMSEAQPCPPAPAPALGEANGGIETLWPARSSEAPASATSAPLRGLRVLDLTAFWAGPAATQMLAMLGADVVKVESIQRPDGMRYSGGLRGDVEEWWEYSWVFQAVNTNKKAVTLDLRSARGKELFGRLAAEADLVTENFPARVMEDLGLDYDALKRLNDRVIFLRMPAFGLDGPWRNRGGFAMTMEQIGGLAWITGYDDDVPTAPRGPCDALAAVHAAFAAMCAVQFRDLTGRGQQVEVPMIETVLNAAALQVIEHDVSGIVLTRRGNHSDRFPVQNVYACAGEEQWIAISVRGEGDWWALRNALGKPDWPLDDQSDQRLADWFRDKSLDLAVSKLLAAGVPAAPVVLPTDVGDNPQLKARVFFETVEHPLCGAIQCTRPPIAPLGDRTHFVDSPAPTLGQHNHEILCQRLGLTVEDVRVLEADGVIGTRPTMR